MRRSLPPCPSSPNCVCSQDPAPSRRVEPLALTRPPAEAMAAIAAAVEASPRARVIERTDRYLRATFTTALFRFRDDLEVLIDPEAAAVHFRSASRVGWWDFGVNRRRVTRLRGALRGRV